MLRWQGRDLAVGGRCGEGKAEDCSARRYRLKTKKPTMLLDHCTAKTQAQPHAFGLGGEKRCEQLLGHLWGDAFTKIRH